MVLAGVEGPDDTMKDPARVDAVLASLAALVSTVPLAQRAKKGFLPIDDRAQFEVLVRLHWSGVAMRWLPTRVGYPRDGVSHFRMVRDNWLITLMHTQLFFGMLLRAPRLVARRLRLAFGTTSGVTT